MIIEVLIAIIVFIIIVLVVLGAVAWSFTLQKIKKSDEDLVAKEKENKHKMYEIEILNKLSD